MQKKLLRTLCTIFMLVGLLSFPTAAQAAQKSNIGLKSNKTYTQYDITGNGKADTIRVNFKSEKYFNIQINGKTAYKLNASEICKINVNLYTLKGNKHFLKLKCQHPDNDHIYYDKLLSYRAGKLTPVVNLMSHRKGVTNLRHDSFTKKVGSNYIQIRMRSMPYGVGAIQYTVTYKLSGSSLKLSGSTFPVTYNNELNSVWHAKNYWVTLKELSILNKPGGKLIDTAKRYEVCTVDKIKYYDGNVYIYITVKARGVSGWIKCPNGDITNRFFEQTYFC